MTKRNDDVFSIKTGKEYGIEINTDKTKHMVSC